jgi:spore coat polysaccharide biosynthesis protein SpsF
MYNPIIVAFIQARMNSTRFPGKVMEKIGDKTLIEILATRMHMSRYINHVFVITTNNPADDVIVKHCEDKNIMCFRGDEENVMKRLVDAAHMIVCDIIVDLTADCPLVEPAHVNEMLDTLMDEKLDYVSNVIERTWPDGLDAQVYYKAALIKLITEYEIIAEHTGWNFIPYKEHFKTKNYPAPEQYRHPDWALTVDHPEDLELIRLLFFFGHTQEMEDEIFSGDYFLAEKALDFLNRFPWLLDINKNKERRDVSHKTHSKMEEGGDIQVSFDGKPCMVCGNKLDETIEVKAKIHDKTIPIDIRICGRCLAQMQNDLEKITGRKVAK